MKRMSILVVAILAAACGGANTASTTPEAEAQRSGIANPASVKCVNDGYRLEIRKAADGGEYGVCINADGKECEEWAYFRGECQF